MTIDHANRRPIPHREGSAPLVDGVSVLPQAGKAPVGAGESQQYAELMAASHRAHEDEVRSLIAELPVAPSDRVLDAPCGDGFHAALFAERMGPRGAVVAVDIDAGALAAARRRAGRLTGGAKVTTVRADIHELPFDDGSFDFAWCAQSLISLTPKRARPTDARTIDALRELRRVVRTGGLLGVLEHDEMHHMLLPWPAELELALQHAQRRGFARGYGNPEQLDVGRRLGRLLAESGLKPERRITLTANWQGAPRGRQREFLLAYFRALRSVVAEDLDRRNLSWFDQLTEPNSPEAFFRDPLFEMTWLEIVCLGRKVSGRQG